MTVLYHYCPTRTFHSIVSTRALWLSSLTQSSDYMEGKLVASSFARLAEADGLDSVRAKIIQNGIDLIEQILDGLGFCLSEEGDLLSQWRGYAADATGVAVGFHSSYLEWLSETSRDEKAAGFTLKKVEYDLQGHDALVAPTYAEVKRLIEAGAFHAPGRRSLLLDTRTQEEIERDDKIIRTANMNASLTILTVFPQLFLLKSPAFREEREWRLISYLVKVASDECSYRSVDNQVIPYRTYEFREIERSPIAEVILGPKHLSPVQVVRDFLKQNGFGDVKVVRSSATYR